MRMKPKDKASWQRWFAWHPVIIDNVTVWLEIVERKRDPDIFDWAYAYRTINMGHRRKRLRAWRAPVRSTPADRSRV